MKYLGLVAATIILSGCAGNREQDHTALFVAIGVAVVVGSIAASGGGGNNSNCVEPIIVNGSPGGTPTVCK